MKAAQFLFVVLVPLVIVGAVLGGLFALGAILDLLEHPERLRARIEGAFRRGPSPPRAPGKDHYYRPHWQE